MNIVTRFAPSPTGDLHIGGARTALFNYLYAKHVGGKFRLRIEDTDQKRSKKEFEQSLINGLAWLGLHHDGEIVYQSQREKRHAEIAEKLVELGHAYYCYTPLEDIQKIRKEYEEEGKVFQFRSEWRNKIQDQHSDIKPVVRLKAPQEGSTTIDDMIQGKVTVSNLELDDMVLLRADGTPTYMLAVVVDDYDMGVTHVIRGDDHLNNAFRQIQIYIGMGWKVPHYAHMPLIHAPDGAKLSKRHGALGLMHYQNEGYLPEALNNYLVRLGWAHGNEEMISREQAIEWFEVKDINKSPARLDLAKMLHVNAHYIKNSDDKRLVKLIAPFLGLALSKTDEDILAKGMPGLKLRAKTLIELADNAKFYVIPSPIKKSQEAKEIIQNFDKDLTTKLLKTLYEIDLWNEENIKTVVKNFAEQHGLKLGEIAQILRSLLTGSTVSPSVFEIMHVLGKEKSVERLRDFS